MNGCLREVGAAPGCRSLFGAAICSLHLAPGLKAPGQCPKCKKNNLSPIAPASIRLASAVDPGAVGLEKIALHLAQLRGRAGAPKERTGDRRRGGEKGPVEAAAHRVALSSRDASLALSHIASLTLRLASSCSTPAVVTV